MVSICERRARSAGASAPETQIFPFVFRDLFADLISERERLHLIGRHIAFELQPVPVRLGADRATLGGYLRAGKTPRAR